MHDLKKDILGWADVERRVIVVPKAIPWQGSGKKGIPIKLGRNGVETVVGSMKDLIKIHHIGGREGSNGSNVFGKYSIQMAINQWRVSAIELRNSIGGKKVPSVMVFR